MLNPGQRYKPSISFGKSQFTSLDVMNGPFNKNMEEKGVEEDIIKMMDGPARITRSMSKCDYNQDELPEKQDRE